VSAEPNIKFRVTGALVLIALAVIFLPLLLDGQKKNQILDSRIPEKPVKGEIILVNIGKSNSTITDEKVEQEQQPKAEVEKTPPSKEVIKEQAVKEVVVTKKSTPPPEVKLESKQPVSKEPERTNRPNYKASAFVIQIGSFSNKSNAQKLVDKLKAAGYKAYLREGKSGSKTISRVLVGPELKRQQAESKIKALNKIAGSKAMVMVYDPVRH